MMDDLDPCAVSRQKVRLHDLPQYSQISRPFVLHSSTQRTASAEAWISDSGEHPQALWWVKHKGLEQLRWMLRLAVLPG